MDFSFKRLSVSLKVRLLVRLRELQQNFLTHPQSRAFKISQDAFFNCMRDSNPPLLRNNAEVLPTEANAYGKVCWKRLFTKTKTAAGVQFPGALRFVFTKHGYRNHRLTDRVPILLYVALCLHHTANWKIYLGKKVANSFLSPQLFLFFCSFYNLLYQTLW